MVDESTATKAATILEAAAAVLRERDADYKGSDLMYAQLMGILFPDGIEIFRTQDHHRFHIFMLMMVKVTRYAKNWDKGHPDSLTDLIAYTGMLAALDRDTILPHVRG
jgi:hypothetical protein